MQRKKRRDAELKAEVVLAALKGGKTLKQLAAEHGVHPVQVSAWKKIFRAGMKRIFSGDGKAADPAARNPPKLREKLERLSSENEWMRKSLAGLDAEVRRKLLKAAGDGLSLRRQCDLLGINRSTLYYRKKADRPENLELMERIREITGKFPGFGVLRVTKALKEAGHVINHKRVRRLMRKMNLMLVCLQSMPLAHFTRVLHSPLLRCLHFHHLPRIC